MRMGTRFLKSLHASRFSRSSLLLSALALTAVALGSGCSFDSTTGSKKSADKSTSVTEPEAKVELIDKSKMLDESLPLRVRWALDLKDRKVVDFWFPPQDSTFDVPYNYMIAITAQNDAIAIDMRSGETIWWTRLDGKLTGKPFATEYSLYLIVNSKVICLDRETGEVAWQVALPFPAATAPLVREVNKGETVFYIGGLDRKIYALELISEEWPPKKADPGHLTQKDFVLQRNFFHINWSNRVSGQLTGDGQISQDRVYFSDWGGLVYGIDFTLTQTGRPEGLWTHKVRSSCTTSPTLVGPSLYVPSSDTYLYCLSRRDGGLIWRYATGVALTRPMQSVSDPNTKRTYLFQKIGEKGPMIALNPRGPLKATTGFQLPLWQLPEAEQIVAKLQDSDAELSKRCVVVVRNTDDSLTGLALSLDDTRPEAEKMEDHNKGIPSPAPVLWEIKNAPFHTFGENTVYPFVFTTTNNGKIVCALELN